jgi:long-subunit fatty acid transport protein
LLPVDQRKTIETTGGTGQWTFALGMNFSNVFYMGFGVGINQLKYDQLTVHSEYYNGGENDFRNFRFSEDLNVEGTGFTANMGMMVRVMKIVKLGASLHLPTFYKLSEVYYNTLSSEFDNDSYDVVPTDGNGEKLEAGTFDYRLSTPLRLLTGASIQLGTAGIIAADIEYVNYSNMRLRERDAYTDFSETNRQIEDAYRSVVNFKLGSEVRFGNLSVRAGGGYYPSPYTSAN